MKTSEIQIRDPFVVPDMNEKSYYIFGTTDKNCWRGPGQGFDCYKSKDLKEWDGPINAFRPDDNFWGKENFWAPEVHEYNGMFYMFATFIADKCYRATHILVSDNLNGPYVPLAEEPVTPLNWQCLDGTLHIDEEGCPWIIFCHEWVQIHNGAVYAMKLTPDLKKTSGKPVFLFNASEAAWVKRSGWPEDGSKYRFPAFVTDGPFLYHHSSGTLLMLWSSFGSKGYAIGISRSETGITGPWKHNPDPLWAEDGGHGMVFRTFEGKLILTFHSPNESPQERALFVELEETIDGLRITRERD